MQVRISVVKRLVHTRYGKFRLLMVMAKTRNEHKCRYNVISVCKRNFCLCFIRQTTYKTSQTRFAQTDIGMALSENNQIAMESFIAVTCPAYQCPIENSCTPKAFFKNSIYKLTYGYLEMMREVHRYTHLNDLSQPDVYASLQWMVYCSGSKHSVAKLPDSHSGIRWFDSLGIHRSTRGVDELVAIQWTCGLCCSKIAVVRRPESCLRNMWRDYHMPVSCSGTSFYKLPQY